MCQIQLDTEWHSSDLWIKMCDTLQLSKKTESKKTTGQETDPMRLSTFFETESRTTKLTWKKAYIPRTEGKKRLYRIAEKEEGSKDK